MNDTFQTLPPLRRALRQLADSYGLQTETRARLVLSAGAVAHPELQSGHNITLTTAYQPGTPEQAAHLAVSLTSSSAKALLHTAGLALPAQTVSERTVTWHIAAPSPTGAGKPGNISQPLAAEQTEAEALEEELAAALARADSYAAEHRLLKHELAETNSGVLALYIQLEKRDEQLRQAHGQMLQELEDALRPHPLAVNGMELAVHYEPAGAHAPTGGDLYDWFHLPDGTVHITVVDALGHGITSTRSALNVTHAVRTLALEGHPLSTIIARTDEIFMPFDRKLMATVLLARINPATGELRLANGSHPPALLIRPGGRADYLNVRGRGIGYPMAGSEAVLHTTMDPGDLLVLYTDGLTESRRDPIEGEARLVTSARHRSNSPTASIPGLIAQDMHTVVLHSDDTLALIVRMDCQEK
ncbi:PP2C family protein-serine/threonine phosphatase [Streptomyces sp. st140]|uniref:PP2C family protein-serine/threonine phosphatase n=1 Tax=Streptomyces sp. st140 TaxID=1828052 RepID=UPI000BF15448|nr:PP2C family protein-serine/threonine phosphatase [Streptomyces sp. st140]